MINNTNEILSQNINEVEGILMEFMHKIVKQEKEQKLDIDSVELLIENTHGYTNALYPEDEVGRVVPWDATTR